MAPFGAFAEDQALIDADLIGGLDFRAPQFGKCLSETRCTIGEITFIAERRKNEDAEWEDGELYWDPIDGFGIRDGAQNDEIDFDERLHVSFAKPITLDRIWFSDLFHTEDRRYGSSETDRIEGAPVDAEVAGVGMYLGEAEIGVFTVNGNDRLPWASFNQEISERFSEDGDMRRRVVINDEIVTLVVPGEKNGRQIGLKLLLGEIDRDKQSIFDGLETVEIDLTEILAEFQNSPLFASGNENFEAIRAFVDSPDALANLKRVAERARVSSDMSNGEVGWSAASPVLLDNLTFFAPFDASNDFSVAGLVTIVEVN